MSESEKKSEIKLPLTITLQIKKYCMDQRNCPSRRNHQLEACLPLDNHHLSNDWFHFQFLAFDGLHQPCGLYYFFFSLREGFLSINYAITIDKMRLFHSFTLWPLMAFISLLVFTTFFWLREGFLSIN